MVPRTKTNIHQGWIAKEDDKIFIARDSDTLIEAVANAILYQKGGH